MITALSETSSLKEKEPTGGSVIVNKMHQH